MTNRTVLAGGETLYRSLLGCGKFSAEGVFLGQRIRWTRTMPWPVLAAKPMTLCIDDISCAVLFRYGVVVMFNLQGERRSHFLEKIGHMVNDPLPETESETVSIQVGSETDEGADFDSLLIRAVDLPRLQLIADVLAKSIVMAYFEPRVSAHFDRIEPLASELHRGWRAPFHSRELLRHIGETLVIQSKMVGHAEVVEKPELLWEVPELDRLYTRLESEYELHERYEVLERKLELITRTVNTQLGLLHHRRSLRVEWYIVILIVVDIIVSLL